MLAPVVLFAYNRPEHTQETLDALKANFNSKDIELYIYQDGLKETATITQKENHQKVKEIIKSQNWCKSLFITEALTNKGLANSIITGVTEVVEKHGKVIVLEDDIKSSPGFINFMNKGLDLYKNNSEVISISAYMYPAADLGRPFFIRGADCWGWATWKRGWDKFQPDGKKLLSELTNKNLLHEFDLTGSYAYSQMLLDQIEGRNNSWAIRWHASAFLNGQLTLYPNRSFVQNIGIDGSGVHSGASDKWEVELATEVPTNFPTILVEDTAGLSLIKNFYDKLKAENPYPVNTLQKRIWNKLKKIFLK